MKKLLISLIAFAILVSVQTTQTFATETDNSVDVNISITEMGNKLMVTIPNDEHYASLRPEIEVYTLFTEAYVEKNGNTISSSINDDGIVTFTITGGGTYVVVEGKAPDRPNSYIFPVTGIE